LTKIKGKESGGLWVWLLKVGVADWSWWKDFDRYFYYKGWICVFFTV